MTSSRLCTNSSGRWEGTSPRISRSAWWNSPHRVSTSVVGFVGLALLAYTLFGTIKKVEDSFNFVWHVDHPRSLARRVAEYLILLIVGPLLLVGFIGLSHAALESAAVQEVARSRVLASRRDRRRSVPHGHGVLHRHVHAHSQHPRALAARPHRRRGCRRALGRCRQDIYRVRGVFHAIAARLCGLRIHRGRAAMDLLRVADFARRRAVVVLHPEPHVPARGAAGTATLVRRDRATRAAR